MKIQMTQEKQDQLILAVQALVCSGMLLYTAASWTKDQLKWYRKKQTLKEKEERKLLKKGCARKARMLQ